MTTIRAKGALWSDEGTGGEAWSAIPESALSYEQVVEAPAPEDVVELERQLNAAIHADSPDLMAIPEATPRYDAVVARWGEVYRAYRAHEDFWSATIESIGQ